MSECGRGSPDDRTACRCGPPGPGRCPRTRHRASPRSLWLALLLLSPLLLSQTSIQYERPVDVAPTEQTIGGDYHLPAVQTPQPRAHWLEQLDLLLLVIALSLSTWVVLRLRSRVAVLALTAACLAYFGFYREGCICPIGAIQNIAVALTDPAYAVPYVVIAFFFLPLLFSLFVGRAFCGGVCPLGAMQELLVLWPVQVPTKLDRALSWLKYVYLALAIWFAIQPAATRDFVICRFDPYVGLFRRTGFAHMFAIGGALLLIGLFVGRPYCRYLCPYGALLSWCARLSRWGVTITPDRELDCGLCMNACPYGAIENLRAVRPACLYCARCYKACPRQVAHGNPAAAVPLPQAGAP